MKQKKAQASLEVVFAFAIILGLFITVILFISNRDKETISTSDFLDKRNTCLELANNINSVYTNGDGAIVRLDETDYIVSFNGEERSIFVDDVFCSIPIKEISNGVHHTFTMSPGVIQMENRDNVVYIGSNCFIDAPVRAVATSRDPKNPVVVTNLVKKDDDVFADVFLPHLHTLSISNKSKWIQENNIRIVYIKLGSACQGPSLEDELKQDFGCNSGNWDRKVNYCDLIKSQTDVDYFFDKDFQKNYTIMVIEDVELKDPQITKLEAALNDKKTGNKWLFITGKMAGNNDKPMFGLNYFWKPADGDGPSIVKNYTDFFFQLIPNSQFFDGVKDWPGVKNTTSTISYTLMANFTPESPPPGGIPRVDSIAKWSYGDGTIYYLSSLKTGGGGGGGNQCDKRLTGNITLAITKLIGSYATGNLNAEFELTELLGGQFQPNHSAIFFSHKEDNVNITIINVTYSDKNSPTPYLSCANLNGTISERLDNCPHESQEQIMNTTINFRAGIKDLNRAAHVDVNYVETCFNPEDVFT